MRGRGKARCDFPRCPGICGLVTVVSIFWALRGAWPRPNGVLLRGGAHVYITRVSGPMSRGDDPACQVPVSNHAAVERAFSSAREKEDGTGRILWRLDVSPRRDRLALYIVSPSRPNLTHMAKQVGCPAAGEGLTKDYAPVLDRISEGQIWAFRLRQTLPGR